MRDKRIWIAAAAVLLAVCMMPALNKGQSKTEETMTAGTDSVEETEAKLPETQAAPEETETAETKKEETEKETEEETVQVSESGAETEADAAVQEPETQGNSAGGAEESVTVSAAGSQTQAAGESGEQVLQSGFIESPEKTAELYRLLAVQNTNNCDLSDSYCSMTADYLAELDRLAESWLQGGMTDAEAVSVMENTEFFWPEDPYHTASHLMQAFAGCYEYSGSDMNVIAGRINLTNMMARHYLFLRVFYDAQADRCRVYMINGLVW